MKRLLTHLSLILIVFTAPSWSVTPNNQQAHPSALAKIIEKSAPAVVSINVVKTPNSSYKQSQQSDDKNTDPKESVALGSGVIISSKNGYVVTNAHVVNDAKLILVRLKNGRRFIARLKGIDRGFDIAVLQIPAHGLHHLDFADSDNIKVGDFVTAIGSPFGLDQTVTSGVISALNVSSPKIEGFQSFIQTDASINPGNSGGPLLNMQGKIVGINTAILGPGMNIGIGFSIPSDMVKSVITQLIKYGEVKRGMLGVVAQNITPELASALQLKQSKGTIVSEVIPGSPAATAGIQVRDVITSINKRPITSSVQLRNMLGVMRPDTKLVIRIKRQQKNITLTAKVGNPNSMIKMKVIPFLAGLKLRDFKELNGDGHYTTGVLVMGIRPTSQAALAGIRPGDIITSAQAVKISTTAQLLTLAKKAKNDLLVKVNRGNMSAFLVIEKSGG